jgi:hypothetical protein
MPFEPAFMRDPEAFRAALAEVGTPAEWARFQARWFADRPWPRRTPEELERLRAAGQTFTVAGRTFTRVPLADDLTPEARYAYFAALAAAFGILFPAPEDQPGAPGSGVRHHCPACEWWTDTPGDPACPACGRALLRMRVAPPG